MKRLLNLFFVSLFVASFVACGDSETTPAGQNGPVGGQGKLTLSVDKAYIKADGLEQATFRLHLMDANGYTYDITSDAEIYCNEEATTLDGAVFTSLTEGEYSFNAIYNEKKSNTVKVTVVNGIIGLPADPDPAGFSFHRRMLLVQHTGTECPNCPRMMNLLKALSEEEAYASKYYHVASHSYNTTDDAYSGAAVILSRKLNYEGYYPWLTFDLTTDYEHDIDAVKSYIDNHYTAEADAGISLAVSYAGGRIYANIGVKAAKSGIYRIGIWVLEDNIESQQYGATASWQHIHNNCLREMVGNNDTARIYGTTFNEIESGEEFNHMASILPFSDWKVENCKVLVFVSRSGAGDAIELVNSALCAVGETTPYAYN